MKSSAIILDGKNLTVEEIGTLIRTPTLPVKIAEEALGCIEKSRRFVEQAMKQKIIYGINTGFGPMASHILGEENLIALQANLIRSHAVGMGKPLPEAYVLAAMIVRLNTLSRGFSGVSLALLRRLETLINNRAIPIVPEHGAVGTSGDLVELAHIASALMGEGELFFQGQRQPAGAVLRALSLEPYLLQPKEGLALINGTSVMAGIGAILCLHARRLLQLAVRTGALALELVGGFSDGISERLHEMRPHRGQIAVARWLRDLLSSSQLLKNRVAFQESVEINSHGIQEIPDSVQEVYSLRCIPQILGPVFDAVEAVQRTVETEINSVTDNPIADWEQGVFLHGGNFHGDYIASTLDRLKAALVKLTMLSERRINFFLNANVNKRFPPFLNLKKPGLTLALQGLQFVATSATARSQSLAFPHHIHSIPTNADNQDIVSMGTDAALLTAQVVENAYAVLAIELVTLAQTVDILSCREELAQPSRELFDQIRATSSRIEDDRSLSAELHQLIDLVKSQQKEIEKNTQNLSSL